MQCTLINPYFNFQVEENDGNTCKELEHLDALCQSMGQDQYLQHFPMDWWLQEEKKVHQETEGGLFEIQGQLFEII